MNNSPSLNQNNPVVGKLVDVGGVARYNINFLPEENECDPIKD
ncbi:43_t:CDS:2 [Entrophospora sp. SA101]|nr:43_t:CDS:2 [Entrophospora sp. SA101]